ncbi:hypothetical protein D3C85_766810 [compost metagenome]
MILAVFEREAGQVKPGDPAFRAAVQGFQFIVVQRDLPLVANEGHGLVGGEAQVTRPDFQQLPTGTNATQANARRRARRHHHDAARGQLLDQLLEKIQYFGVLDDLYLVEQDGKRRCAGGDLLQQVVGALLFIAQRFGGHRQQAAQAVVQ